MRFLLTCLAAGLWFTVSAMSYWWGRVLLPELGLRAPGYWTWFWSYLPAVVGYAVYGAVTLLGGRR